jgi:2'-5' RNA ligase
MDRELAVSLNIVIPSQIKERIIDVQHAVNQVVEEQRYYDYSPHLAVVTKFMVKDVSDEYVEVVAEELKEIKQFALTFAGFAPSETNNYIFLNFEEASKNNIFELNKHILTATKKYGNETPGGLPARYPFDPHISIIKLKPFEVKKALHAIRDDFAGEKMLVTELEITRENRREDGFGEFPVVAKIKLQSK